MKPSQYICLDVETTGLDASKHAIVELAAIALDANLRPRDDSDIFQTLVQPRKGAEVHPTALEVNGHHWCRNPESKTYQKAASYQQAWHAFMEYMAKHFGKEPTWIIMTGWNVSFDESFLRGLHAHASGAWPFHYHKLDYLSICRYLDIQAKRTRYTYKLERVAAHYFGKERMKTAHTALADTRLAIETLEAVENDDRRDLSL